MPDPFRLPRIKTLDRIVEPAGTPTVPFIKFFNTDFAGAIERQEAAQAEIIADLEQAILDIQALQTEQAQIIADLAQAVSDIQDIQTEQAQILIDLAAQQAALQDEVDRLTAVLAGTGEPFTGLNVGGTNVKAFLDRTDGSALTDTAGLGPSVVTSAAVALGTINQTASAFTLGLITVPPSGFLAVQSLTVTVEADEVVDLTGAAAVEMTTPSAVAGIVAVEWYRGATFLSNGYTAAADTGAGATPYVFQPVTVPVNALDIPGAGTWTYDLMVGTGASNSADITRRSARINTFRRSA